MSILRSLTRFQKRVSRGLYLIVGGPFQVAERVKAHSPGAFIIWPLLDPFRGDFYHGFVISLLLLVRSRGRLNGLRARRRTDRLRAIIRSRTACLRRRAHLQVWPPQRPSMS